MLKAGLSLLVAATLGFGLATPATAETRVTCRAEVPLDTTALRKAISGLPHAEVNAALVRATGPDGCWSGTAGTADRSTGAPVADSARFRIGSVTKVFTAVLVLQLAAEGRLGLDDTIQQHLPGLLPADYPAVSVRQLLNYTSGLPSPVVEDQSIEYQVAHRFDRWTPGQYVEAALRHPREFEPGEKQHYRNIGYVVAGMLVEKVSGQSYEDRLRSSILRPLRLTDTTSPGHDPAIRGVHVRGYQRMSDGELRDVTSWNQSFGWATSSIVSSTRDLDTFTRAVFGDLLPEPVRAELFAVPEVPGFEGGPAVYGGGLERFEIPGIGVLWGKTGGWYGYLAGVGGTSDGSRRLVYGVTANDAKRAAYPITQKIVGAGMTLEAA